MATQCREQSKINKNRRMRSNAFALLAVLLLIGGVAGFFLGRSSAPEKTVTLTNTVEVPVQEPVKQRDISETHLNDVPLSTDRQGYIYDVPLSTDLQEYIRELCNEKNVPMELVLAIIDIESSFTPDVISTTNDFGLMQINACNHETLTENLGITDFLDPYQNAKCGIYIIASHLQETDGDIALALMRYNCGATGAKRLWDKGVYSTNYTKKIMTAYYSYLTEAQPGD